MSDILNVPRLRILTYMCPDIPIETFTLLRNCLEDATGLEADLIVEDRFTGPVVDRTDPFNANLADLVFLHSSDYLRLKDEKHPNIQLCPAAPVYYHPRAPDKAVYFSEIIIHSNNKEKYKSIQELKGCSWAYNHSNSLSGNIIVLDYLKKHLKTDASYFGTIIESGSHLNSIKMVRDFSITAAAVDSVVLAGYLKDHEDHADVFTSIETLGPLPIYPCVFNSQLPESIKQTITNALLSMDKSVDWSDRLRSVGILKFVPVDDDLYYIEKNIQAGVSGMSIQATFY
ncbi:hypothetical protein BgiMline_027779 [Biomphalaria glabrata]|uniref:Uncharacterized protein LOC106074752 n=1 Tax=Biomphalaria glabrata TaxID=6526 RepID=A0A2C9KH88_BIOGL|nr:uncharacterized protein LOC106074752 [Biomphalaria glabrata]XP_013091042.1 uncharacterized protein LOC106074752 [Biomphalaria glabrata]KAI8753084.1 hypothetical protein BgiMline_013639 [Biomphalaria glabrata]KAI8782841.1 hypothetical protein BgiBS90_016328 [Biomphalaria glabrata]